MASYAAIPVFYGLSQERDKIHERSSHLVFYFSFRRSIAVMWVVLCGVVDCVISCIILFMILKKKNLSQVLCLILSVIGGIFDVMTIRNWYCSHLQVVGCPYTDIIIFVFLD